MKKLPQEFWEEFPAVILVKISEELLVKFLDDILIIFKSTRERISQGDKKKIEENSVIARRTPGKIQNPSASNTYRRNCGIVSEGNSRGILGGTFRKILREISGRILGVTFVTISSGPSGNILVELLEKFLGESYRNSS